MVITALDGTVSYQGYNGTTGWLKTPTQQSELSSTDLARLRQQQLYNQLTLKDQFTNLRVGRKQKVNDRDAYVVVERMRVRSASDYSSRLWPTLDASQVQYESRAS